MTRRPLGASVEEAIDLALDVYIDTLTGGADLNVAFNAIAVNVLDFASAQTVDLLDATSAVLDDGTILTLRPDWAPVGALLRARHMLGYRTVLGHLPTSIATIETVEGSTLTTWPMLDTPVLRGFNDYQPVLTRADGTALHAPHDALATDGTLLVTPSLSLAFNSGDVTFTDIGIETRPA